MTKSKVFQLSVHYPPNVGGVETHLSDLVEELVKRNFNVFVLTYLPLTARVKAKIWESKKNLKILRLPWIAGLFYKLVKNPAVEFIYLIPFIFFFTPLVLLYFRPNVLHTHGLIAGFAGVFWSKIFGVRAITTTHSLYHFPRKGMYTTFAKWIFSNSSQVLTLSKQSKKEIERLGIRESKITVFTYWVDLDKFKSIPKAKEKVGWENKFVVLFVGRLVEEKGVLVLLESLKSWNKNIFLAIVGTGPLESVITKQKTVNRNLLFLGKIDNDKLPLYYSAADLVIVPSIHEEGFGRVILESLACGTPVVAANRGAIPEAMNKTVGKLIEVNMENIAKAVNFYNTHTAELQNLSENASKYSKIHYSPSNILTIYKVYE